jgi:uncharacterized protein
MNSDSHDPVDPPPVARPAEPPPFASVVRSDASLESVSYAAVPVALPTFPLTSLSQGQALVDLVVVAGAIFAGQFLLGSFISLLKETLEEHGALILNTVLGVMTLAIVGLALYARRLAYTTIGLGLPNARVLLLSAVAAIPACYLVSAIMGFLFLATNLLIGGESIEDTARQRQEFFDMVPESTIWTFILFAAFTGLHEEVLFRGFAMPRLIAVFNSKWAGIAACSAIFGMAHIYQGTMSIFQTAGLGLLFCLVSYFARSIWPAVIAHALFNGINLALIPILRDMLPEMLKQVSSQPAH